MRRTGLSILAACLLASCGGRPQPAADAQGGEAPDGGYALPPALTGARPEAGAVILQGRASPGARVRLATPSGEALFAVTDAKGDWRLSLPAAAEARIFGLSMTEGDRQVMSQGYVLVTPGGQAAVLRAGAGALSIAPSSPPRITAVDFDHERVAIVSGVAPPQAAIALRIDSRPAAATRAGNDGRFSVPLARPIAGGRRELEVRGDAFSDKAAVEVSPAPAGGAQPFSARAVEGGLRADWMTPGGGVQSTVLLD